MNWEERVTIRPEICHGKACIEASIACAAELARARVVPLTPGAA